MAPSSSSPKVAKTRFPTAKEPIVETSIGAQVVVPVLFDYDARNWYIEPVSKLLYSKGGR